MYFAEAMIEFSWHEVLNRGSCETSTRRHRGLGQEYLSEASTNATTIIVIVYCKCGLKRVCFLPANSLVYLCVQIDERSFVEASWWYENRRRWICSQRNGHKLCRATWSVKLKFFYLFSRKLALCFQFWLAPKVLSQTRLDDLCGFVDSVIRGESALYTPGNCWE